MSKQPTPTELGRLFRAAIKLHADKSWDSLGDRSLAIENPETRVVGFVVAGEDFYGDGPGAIVLLDPEAMRVFNALNAAGEAGTDEYTDLGMRQNAVVVGFEALDDLPDDEREQIGRLGIEVDPEAVPVFVRESPGMLPQPPDGASTRFAAIALEQLAAAVATLDERSTEHTDDSEILVRVEEDGEWRDQWRQRDEVLDVDYGAPPEIEPEWKALAKSIKRHRPSWEYGAMLLPSQFDGTGPALACLHMIVDNEEVVGSSTEPHRNAEGLCNFLAATIEHHGIAPKKLVVADPGLGNAVSALARLLKIEIELTDYLPTVGPIYAEIMADAYGGDEDDDELDEDDDELDYDLPSGRQTIEMPEGFRLTRLTVDYDIEEDEPESEEAALVAEAFERVASDPGSGLAELEELIGRFPSNETLRIALMSTLASLGREKEARAAATAARAAFPESFEMRVAHANLLAELGDGDGALEALGGASEMADLFPGREEFRAGDLLLLHTSLYRIHMTLERHEAAGRHLEVLRRILPDNPDFAMVAEAHAQKTSATGNGASHS